MPFRIRTSRAYQFAQDPESLVRITSSGRRGDSSQVTRCGLTGLAGCMARLSIRSHQWDMPLAIPSRKDVSALGVSRGNSAFRVSAASPARFTSIG